MAKPLTTTASTERAPSRLLNRELSWLEYEARLLELAEDPSLALLERVRICKFFSSNLDEFFMVRVAGLAEQAEAGLAVLSPDGRTPEEALAEIRARVLELTARQARLWKRDLRPALAEAGVIVAAIEDLDEEETFELERLFETDVFPVLTPLGVGPGQPFPYISGLSLSLGVFVRDPDTGDERFARVKVPELLPRFLPVGTRGAIVPLERVIRHFLPRLFTQMEIVECALFRVTRDADLEVDDDAADLLEAVRDELRRRRFGEPVRLEASRAISNRMLNVLKHGLNLPDDEVYLVEGLMDLADLGELESLPRPELKPAPWLAPAPGRLAGAHDAASIFEQMKRGDLLVHHPYDSFAGSFEAFVRGAASDPDVVGLKTTVYRTNDESPLIPALITAAEEGKQTVCLVELKARFDEHRNIEWSRSLEQSGVHVVYGFPNLKIHAKTTLVVRREGKKLRRYAHVGTGNYHSVTARAYEDFGLFTADPDICSDIADLFNYLTGYGRPQRLRKLLAAPFDLRKRLIEEIRTVAKAARNGKHARIRIKVNALTDPAIIDELYAASGDGATVEIVARSICALRPGVEGLSENITVRSVLGRFLEHSRIFVFEAGDDGTFLIGSADLMPRNLDHRVEIVAPVEESRARGELTHVFDTLLSDNAQAWELSGDGTWTRAQPAKGRRAVTAQGALMRSATSRARRRTRTRRPA
jgi:polyphosphate kinase